MGMNTAIVTNGSGLQRGCIISLHTEKGRLAAINRNGRWELDAAEGTATPPSLPNMSNTVDISMAFTLCVSDDRRYVGFRSAAANGMTLQACPGKAPCFANWNFKSYEMWEIPHGVTWADLSAGKLVTFSNAKFGAVSLAVALAPLAVLPWPALSQAQQVQECNRQLIASGLEAERLVHDLRESERRLSQQAKRDKAEQRRLAAQVSELQLLLAEKARQVDAMQAELAWRAQEAGALQEMLRASQAHGSELEEALLLWRVRQRQLVARGVPPTAPHASQRPPYAPHAGLPTNHAAGHGHHALQGAQGASLAESSDHPGYRAFAGREQDGHYGMGASYHSSAGTSHGNSAGNRQLAALSSGSSQASPVMCDSEAFGSHAGLIGYQDDTFASSNRDGQGERRQDGGSPHHRRVPPPAPPPPARGQSWSIDTRPSRGSAGLEDADSRQVRRQVAPPKPLSSEQLAMATLQQAIREEIGSGSAKARLRKVHPSQGDASQGPELSPRSRTLAARQARHPGRQSATGSTTQLPESPASVDAASITSVSESDHKQPPRRPLAPLSNNLLLPSAGTAKDQKPAEMRKVAHGGVERDQENVGRPCNKDLIVQGMTPVAGRVDMT